MKRRKFLKTAATTGIAAGAGVFSILKFPRGAQAAGWGAWPTDDKDKAAAFLPEELQAKGILELHINGGMSHFDTFYTVPQWGQDDNRFLHLYREGSPAAGADPNNSVEGRWESCGSPGGNDITMPLGATDGEGNEVHLGPWTWPFWSRPDVMNRMRVTITSHDQMAHEGANPKSFTGLALGSPRMAGVGTPIQRYYSENEGAPGGGGIRAAPYSYVLYPAGYKPFNAVAASSVGSHPGSARPLVVSVEADSVLTQLLARSATENPERFDKAIAFYQAEHQARLKSFGHSATARSSEGSNYDFSVFARENAPELTSILSDDLFSEILVPGPICTTGQNGVTDAPSMQARMATSLLTREEDRARYVLWIDAGVNPRPTGGHDVHGGSVFWNAINLPHTFQALLDQIKDPFNKRPGDDQRLDLDEHMIVINTEFGRAPDQQGNGTGTNHHAYGYAQIFIGGPIGAGLNNPSPSVYGFCREADGYAPAVQGASISPAQSRIMMLQAMGIYPFSSQSYNVQDGGFADEVEAAVETRDTLLGVSV